MAWTETMQGRDYAYDRAGNLRQINDGKWGATRYAYAKDGMDSDNSGAKFELALDY